VPWAQRWSLIAIIGLGLVLMFGARVISRSPFFQIPRESDAAGREPRFPSTR
jgi:hypothetical protein